MSGKNTVNKDRLVAVKEVALKVGYSRDYITRLAREQKITASQIGRQWFVDPDSLRSFVDFTEIEKKARKNQLRAERQLERSIYEEQQKLQEEIKAQVVRFSPGVYMKSWTIILAGLFLGVVIHSTQLSFLGAGSDQVAQLPTINISDTTVIVEEISTLTSSDKNSDSEITIVNQASKEVQAIPQGHGVLLLPELASADDVENPTVDELFSDEIKVEEGSDRSGYVVPVYDDGQEGVAVPYVMIPVDTYDEAMKETLDKKHYE